MVQHLLLGLIRHPLLLVCQQIAHEQLAWEKENSRNDKCDQVSICEQKSKNHCCRSHIVPSSPRQWAVLQFAVVCFASAPLNGGAYAAIVEHGLFDVCQSESTTQLWLPATNCVRVNVLHEHVCALNSQVLDREWGSPHFGETEITKTNCSHRENECV